MNMENKIVKASYISFVLLIVLIIFEIITMNNVINIREVNMRKIKVVASYFFHLPIFIINLVLTIKVFSFYYKNTFQKPLKYLYLVIPSIFYYIICFIYIIIGILK